MIARTAALAVVILCATLAPASTGLGQSIVIVMFVSDSWRPKRYTGQ